MRMLRERETAAQAAGTAGCLKCKSSYRKLRRRKVTARKKREQ